MTLLSTTLLALGLLASRPKAHPAPLDELPKAPVEITLPAASEKVVAPAKAAAPANGAARARPSVHILVLPPSLAKPPSQPSQPAASAPPAQENPSAAPQPTPATVPATPPAAQAAAPAAGPKAGDVVASTSSTALPLERQPGYELVVQKCGRCHSVEKALHARFTAGDWDAYLKKKFRRNGAGISLQQAEEISAFLRGWAIRAGRP
jgi:hypothetical protein